jgi:death-on-curing protein
MTGDDDSVDDLSARLRFLLLHPIDFRRTDTGSTIAKVRILTAAATYLNTLTIAEHGGRSGSIRAPGMVEQVIGAAFQTFESVDPHPDPFDKAAMLLRGITQGHPFEDGNKRTGFLIVAFYLNLMGIPLPAAFDRAATVELCLAVSSGAIRDVSEIGETLRTLWASDSS